MSTDGMYERWPGARGGRGSPAAGGFDAWTDGLELMDELSGYEGETGPVSGKIARALRLAPVIERFRGDLPFGIPMAIAENESDLDPGALNRKSGAAGLWQVVPKYTTSYGMSRLEERGDLVVSTRGVLAVIARNARWLSTQEPQLTADDRAGILYYIHGEGRGSLVKVTKLLRDRGIPFSLEAVLAARRTWNAADGFRLVARRWRDWEAAKPALLAGRTPSNASVLVLSRRARLARARASATPVAPVTPPAPHPAVGPSRAPGLPVGFVVNGVTRPAPGGLAVRNFLDPAVNHFVGRRRVHPVTEFVVHESVTRSAADTVTVLRRRGLGVHLIGAPDGVLSQHADLATEVVAHAGGHNARSVGIEVVNPYYPRYVRPGAPWTRVIEAGWAHQHRYVVPTPRQAEALALLVGWVTSRESGLSIPRRWIGVSNGRMAMGRVAVAAHAGPGIYAHTYFGHSDGAWLVLYAYLRLEVGYAPQQAYAEAIRLASIRGSVVTLPSRARDARQVEPAVEFEPEWSIA